MIQVEPRRLPSKEPRQFLVFFSPEIYQPIWAFSCLDAISKVIMQLRDTCDIEEVYGKPSSWTVKEVFTGDIAAVHT